MARNAYCTGRSVLSALASGAAAMGLLAGCSAISPASLLSFLPGQSATAVLLLDYEQPVRTTNTIAANATKARIEVYGPTDKLVAVVPMSDIPEDGTYTLFGLPAGSELRFKIVLADDDDVEVGKALVRKTLQVAVANQIPATVYMNSGALTGGTTYSTAQSASSDKLATRVSFEAGFWYLMKPSVSAVDANNAPVACNPAYSITSGYETLDDHGESTTYTQPFRHFTETGTFDVQVLFTPNCPPNAATIVRKLEFQRIATVTVEVD